MTSFLLSMATAFRVSDFIFSPALRLKKDIQYFTAMEIIRMIMESQLKVRSSGWIILRTASLQRENPSASTMTDTVSPARYSYLAWP